VISSSRRLSFGRGEVDIAVMIGTVEEDSLVIRPVSEAGWALYAAEGYLAGAPPFGTAADLTRHRVLGLPPELSDQPAASWLREKAGEAIIPLNLSPISEVVAAAAESAGIALLPCLLADREPRLKRLLPDVLVVCHPVTLVYRPDIAEDRDGRLVLRTLAAALGEVSGAFRGEKAA
jgi:DNA-binding transcriptional LysR family regulator